MFSIFAQINIIFQPASFYLALKHLVLNDSKLFFKILKGHIQVKYCFESQKCLKSKYAFQFYVRPKHSEMSIVFLC